MHRIETKHMFAGLVTAMVLTGLAGAAVALSCTEPEGERLQYRVVQVVIDGEKVEPAEFAQELHLQPGFDRRGIWLDDQDRDLLEGEFLALDGGVQ